MYEDFFDLKRRPFAVTPDPGCWHHQPPFQPALDELVVCAEQGQGIGILVAPAGAGKTIVCERLIRELRDQFATVLLRHATFTTRRSLLQSLLCELKRPFDKSSDQELRLETTTALRELHQAGKALVLVVDEAHQLSEAVLDELRILADQAIDGRPLVRLILSGQLRLEEQLALPGAQALNQRIRAHVTLPTLTQSESADYVDYRITWAGGRTTELFTPEALDLICQASDGLPRCLNQLCDHALLLSYVQEERPVSAQTVTEALADLSHLPLPWRTVHPLPVIESPTPFSPPSNGPGECPDPLGQAPNEAEIEDIEPDDVEPAIQFPELADETPPFRVPPPVMAQATDPFCEEVVVDRYTALDAGLEPPINPPIPASIPVIAATDTLSAWWNDASLSQKLTERLAAVQHVLEAVTDADDEPLSDLSVHSVHKELPNETTSEDSADPEDQLAASVFELAGETRSWIEKDRDERKSREEPGNQAAAFEFGAEIVSSPTEQRDATPRSCRNLFTLLRRKQQGRL